MLNTNSVSHLLRKHPVIMRRVTITPMASLCLSVITEAEMRYGLAKRPDAKRLYRAVGELLLRLDVLPWDSDTAQADGTIRASPEQHGKSLVPLDLLIAAHAVTTGCTLVSNDKAFTHLAGLTLEDWPQE